MDLVRYLNPADRKPEKITKGDKKFAKKLTLKTEFPVKIWEIRKIEKNSSISISVFGYESKEKHPIYVLKQFCEEKHVDLLLIGEEGKRCYLLIKDFNTFMYDHTLHRGKNILTVIAYKLLVQKKYQNVILKIASKLMANKGLQCLKMTNMLNSEIIRKK